MSDQSRVDVCTRFVRTPCYGQIVRLQHVVLPVNGVGVWASTKIFHFMQFTRVRNNCSSATVSAGEVRVLHAIAGLPRRAIATSSRSSACARPVLETASRTICSWATTRTSLPDQVWMNRPQSLEQEPRKIKCIRGFINKSVSKVLTRFDRH